MDVKLTRDNNITTGKIYQASFPCHHVHGIMVLFFSHLSQILKIIVMNLQQTPSSVKNSNLTVFIFLQSVIDKERRGDYLGKTVQVLLLNQFK